LIVGLLEMSGFIKYAKRFEFSAQVRVFYGKECTLHLPGYLDEIGAKRVILVCGKKFRETQHFEMITRILGKRLVATFDSVLPHPTVEICERAGRLARDKDVDAVLSVGGGSSIDTGKAVTLLKDEGTDLKEYLVSYDPVKGRSVKEFKGDKFIHIAIPTTFSSAEANGSAAVVDPVSRRKMILWSDASLPLAVFLDPVLPSTLPRELKAASGMNTLAHGIETMYSSELQPISEALALGSLELIKNNLMKCVEGELEATGMMQIASVMAGFAYANAVVSLHHAICHVLGALFNIHHGIANAIMLPYVMKDMVNYVPGSVARIGYMLGIAERQVDEVEAAERTVQWVEEFRDELNTPKRLRDVLVPQSKLPLIAEETMQDWVAFQGIRKIQSVDEILKILEDAW
jgi:alcohol dehydrogenase class IV